MHDFKESSIQMATIINYAVNSIKRLRGNDETGNNRNNINLFNCEEMPIPLLVLLNIFDHLNIGDILKYRLVNSDWNMVFIMGGFLSKHFKITITPSAMANPQKKILVVNEESVSEFSNVRMLQFTPASLDWPNEPIRNITTLEISSCILAWVQFQQVLISLNDLRKLSLDSLRIHNPVNQGFELGFDNAVRRIRSLTLKRARIPNAPGSPDLSWPIYLLAQFKDPSHLQELTLNNVTMKEENYEHPLSQLHTEFVNVLEQVLIRNRKSLKTLRISNTKFFYHKLNLLPSVFYTQILPSIANNNEENGRDMKLRQLVFPSWRDMHLHGGVGVRMIESVGHFLEQQNHLRSLEMPYFPRRLNTVFQRQLAVEICKLWKLILQKSTIKSLQLPKCEYFKDLKDMSLMPNLRKVLIGQSEVSGLYDMFNPKLSYEMMPMLNIRVFQIHSRTPNMTGKISFLCHLFPNLEELSLGIMNFAPTLPNDLETTLFDIDIHHILKNLRKLKKLEIGICEMLTDKALCGEKMSLCEEITACSILKRNPWFEDNDHDSQMNISSLKNLESLIFKGKAAFTDEGLSAIKFPSLRYIELPSSNFYSFRGLERMLNNNPSLENLLVQSSSILPMNSIMKLRKMMKRVQLMQSLPMNPMIEYTRDLRKMLSLNPNDGADMLILNNHIVLAPHINQVVFQDMGV